MSNESSAKRKADDTEENLEKRNWKPFAQIYDPVKIGSINGIGNFPHDKAITRAIYSKYVPTRDKVPEQDVLRKTLIIAQLAPHVAEEELERLFSKYGKVIRVKVIRDLVTKRSKGYCFVEFERSRYAERAYDDGKNIVLGGHNLILDKAISRSLQGWKPRRFGGGFGGSKNSGQLRFGCKARPWLRPIFKSERKRFIMKRT